MKVSDDAHSWDTMAGGGKGFGVCWRQLKAVHLVHRLLLLHSWGVVMFCDLSRCL